MEIQTFQEISGEGFIKINGEIMCKYCEKVIENVTLKKINYFEVREETEENLRNKVEMLCNEYFLEGMTHFNEREEKCLDKNMNSLQTRKCKITAYRNNQKIYEQTENRNLKQWELKDKIIVRKDVKLTRNNKMK